MNQNLIEVAVEAGFNRDELDNQECPCSECNFMAAPVERFSMQLINSVLDIVYPEVKQAEYLRIIEKVEQHFGVKR